MKSIKQIALAVALVSLVYSPIAVASEKGKHKTKHCIEESMQKLFEVFQAVDIGFNTKGGLTVPEIVALGIYDEFSTAVAHGPFTPDVCGHLGHTNQPGSFQAFGATECAELQVAFEGALLQDPYFPFCDLSCAPKLFHTFPIVTAVINDELVNVSASAIVHYPGENGPVVAVIRSIAQYRLNCHKGKVKVPVIVWIHFNISYDDCTLTCPPCVGTQS